MSKKVAVIGAGYVGSSIAYTLLIKSIANEVVLIDKNEEKCFAEISDIRHGIPSMGSSCIYSGSYEDIKDCDLIIITAGRNRRPGETRMDLMTDNLSTTRLIADEIKKHYTGGVVLIVTNPVDIITKKMTQWLDLPTGRVFGTGCLLDSSRLICIIAEYIGVQTDSVSAYIIGLHGEGQVILWSKVLIDGKPVTFEINTQKEIEDRVTGMGTSIIKGKSRTHYGIAISIGFIADTILNDQSVTLSVSSVLSGEYGVHDIALSLPSIVNSKGIERVLTETLSKEEYTRFKQVAAHMKKRIVDTPNS